MDKFLGKTTKTLNSDLERIAITCGDAGENHQGMEMVGSLGSQGSGFTVQDLTKIKQYLATLNKQADLIDLSNTMAIGPDKQKKEAAVLILRNYLDETEINQLYQELTSVPWDNKYWDTRRQKVLNKRARENLLFLKGVSQEADYPNKKGRIVDINSLSKFDEILTQLFDIINQETDGKAQHLIAEGNRYFKKKMIDSKLKNVKNGIGWHGDAERRKVICLCIGGVQYPMHWQWFYKHKPLNLNPYKVALNSGDVYIMSEEAVGQRWKNSSEYTMRHSAGDVSFTKYKKEWIEHFTN